MLTHRTNYHHSKLPKIGEVGFLRLPYQKPLKCRVAAFPLSDNVLPYSIGIHTAFFQVFRNGLTVRASGFYFEEGV